MFESWLNVLAHQGNDDEDTKNTVDHARNGGEKIDKEFERVGNSCGGELSEKKGGANAEGNCDDQRNASGDDRSVNKWQSAELFEDGVPDGETEKIKANPLAPATGPLPHPHNEHPAHANDT